MVYSAWVRTGAGAGAVILTSWSRSRAKIERLHNTTGEYLELADVLCPTLRIVEVGQEELLLPLRVARPAQLSLHTHHRSAQYS